MLVSTAVIGPVSSKAGQQALAMKQNWLHELDVTGSWDQIF